MACAAHIISSFLILTVMLFIAHCHLEEDLVKFEKLSNDPEISCVLKSIEKFLKSRRNRHLHALQQSAAKFFTVQDKIREEIVTTKQHWRSHFNLLSKIDELGQCKRAMRLQYEGEDVSELTQTEAAFIIDPSNIAAESMEHEVKQATALAELRRNKDSLRYLKNQRLERNGEAAAAEAEATLVNEKSSTCAVCLSAFGEERSVLPCGHIFHPECVDRLFRQSGGRFVHCPLRCRNTVRREDVLLASEKSKEDGSSLPQEIKGDWGTKVNRLIADVMDLKGDRAIIFSQWEEMLDVIAEGLGANQIIFVRPRSGKRFGEDIKRFRSSDAPILLMNVKNGAEGLTLTEANHVFMVEPMLNCGLDSQAINRVHRIGQASRHMSTDISLLTLWR